MRDPWSMKGRQFAILYRVFLARVVDLELLSADADTTRLVGQFLTIFSYFSFWCSIPALLIGRNMPSAVARTPEHFFIATTMVVAGCVSVLAWDSVFPDRRDALVLAPLPVPASTLFVAKVAALLSAPALAVFALNALTGLTWPIVFMSHRVGFLHSVRAWPAYWGTMVVAGGFVFCSFLGVQGLLANLLPRQIYLRLSAFVQAGALCILLSQYFLEPSLEATKALVATGNQRMLTWLPSYWFLGLFQQLNGSLSPEFAPLARRAWLGLLASVCSAGMTVLLSYFRMLPKVIEQPDILPGRRVTHRTSLFGCSIRGAIILFSTRTLIRSRQHRVLLSLYLGIGLAVVVGYLKSPLGAEIDPATGIGTAFLAASMLVILLVVLATRVVSSIPISLQANWVFRVTQVEPVKSYQTAIRTTWLMIGVVPMWLIAACAFHLYAWRPVAGHLILLLLLGTLLVELSLYGFHKIPFACSYLPGKANLHLIFCMALVLLLWLMNEAAKGEGWLLRHLFRVSVGVLMLALATGAARWLNDSLVKNQENLVFEEEDSQSLVTLRLN